MLSLKLLPGGLSPLGNLKQPAILNALPVVWQAGNGHGSQATTYQ